MVLAGFVKIKFISSQKRSKLTERVFFPYSDPVKNVVKKCKKSLQIILILGIFGSFLSSCSSMDMRSDTAEGSFKIAEQFEKDDRYEEAIRRYKEVKNKFPYSQYAVKAELKVADVQFLSEEYGEAQISYQTFKDLHPKHEQIDYVIFRIGLSLYNQLPSTIDRDLTLAQEVVTTMEELIRRFPQSQYFKEATEHRLKTLKMMAEKEKYIADFYFKRSQWLAALGRYEDLYKKFPDSGFEPYALLRASQSADKLEDTSKSRAYLNLLKSKFPQSSEALRGEPTNFEEGN